MALYIQVGQIILQASGTTNIKRTTLELGGKSPNVVMDDADSSYQILKIINNCKFSRIKPFFSTADLITVVIIRPFSLAKI